MERHALGSIIDADKLQYQHTVRSAKEIKIKALTNSIRIAVKDSQLLLAKITRELKELEDLENEK